MKLKRLINLSLLLFAFLFIKCSNHSSNNSIDSKYVGIWQMKIKKLPKVGDVNFTMKISEKDSVFSGFFVEEDGDTVDFSNIQIEDGYLNTKYNWSGHDVGFKVKVNENDRNIVEGTFMRFFDVEGKRES